MVLVSILGDFHSSILPVFFELKDKITHHIIIHDDSKYDTAHVKKLLKAQVDFRKQYKNKDKYKLIGITLDEDNYDEIISSFEQIKKVSKSLQEIYLNTTDGLSSISIILSSKILECGGNVISYDRYANTYNLHTKDSMEKKGIQNNMDIKNHLMLKGYNLVSYSDPKELNNRKNIINEISKDLETLKVYADSLHKKNSSNCKGFDNIKKLLKKIKKQNEISFIQGAIFEEYIYHLIKDNFDFDDVMLGAMIEFNENHKNELDILMIKDNHLHTIECKFVNKLKGEHFIYKTNSIIDYLDDDGKAMILSIGADNTRKTNHGPTLTQFTIGDKARAENGNIKIYQSKVFDKYNFLDVVKNWFLRK